MFRVAVVLAFIAIIVALGHFDVEEDYEEGE